LKILWKKAMEQEQYEQYAGDIALISMSGRFPGARNIQEFWHNLSRGKEAIEFFTEEHLLAEGVAPATIQDPNYVRAGAVLENIEAFDAAFFDITPRDAALMDPQQRIFLECAWEALEEAGYDTQRCEARIGVFAGAGMNTYLLNNLTCDRELLEREGTFQIGVGNEKDYLATRTSYKLNLNGPSISVGTSCSTSLVAVHLATQSLLSHECDMALAGGVAIKVPHAVGYRYQEGGIASPDGHCRAFDKDARGTIRANGVGVVLLKRLPDALRDRDRVLAVIKGSAVNNDGADKIGYTAPGVSGQAAVIVEAQEIAGVTPEMIDYIEAHGTGTQLGDPIEVMALTQAFQRATARRQYCALGSVKSNIGHLDAASGIAGLIKVVLALTHRQIPPGLHFVEPNPEIPFATSPFFVNQELRDWEEKEHPRTAGVSSFGIGGTNAHVIVQEAPPVEEQRAKARPCYLLPLTAKSPSALTRMRSNLAASLERDHAMRMADVAATLQLGRRQFEHRSFVLCRDREEAIKALNSADQGQMNGAVMANIPEIAFLFPGQGSQHIQMAAEVYRHEPVFCAEVDHCAEYLLPLLQRDIRAILYPDQRDAEWATKELTQTALAQPALFMIEYALARQWMAWGIQPAVLLGHSVGEYVAACLAGVFTLEDALGLIVERGRLIQKMPAGSMLAVPLTPEEVQLRIKAYPRLSLAVINTPTRCVVAGPLAEVERFAEQLNQQNILSRLLHTSHAFHSAMMEPLVSVFAEQVRRVPRRHPTIPILSNLSGTWMTNEEATDAGYWANHLRQTVNFAQCARNLLARPALIVLEVGPGTTLISLLKQHPAYQQGQLLLPSLSRPKEEESDLAILLRALGQCWLQGKEIAWSQLSGEEGWRKVPLPTYPFEPKKHWIAALPAPSTVPQKPSGAVAPLVVAPSMNRNGQSKALPGSASMGEAGGVMEIFEQQLSLMAQQIEVLSPKEPSY
jgi:phthiocerol/phenolphthiocerol synthesis type-I polyketide synthase E